MSSITARSAAGLVKKGGLLVFPSDTVYGLGCDPMNEAAVERLFTVKRREAKPIPVLCADLTYADRLVSLDPVALSLARRYWPGALTVVAPMIRELPFQIHQGTRTLGVRVPASNLCIQLIAESGGYLTGTSANLSGRPACRSASEAMAELGGEVDLILDGGTLAGKESTVVKVTEGKLLVLRRGAVELPRDLIGDEGW